MASRPAATTKSTSSRSNVGRVGVARSRAARTRSRLSALTVPTKKRSSSQRQVWPAGRWRRTCSRSGRIDTSRWPRPTGRPWWCLSAYPGSARCCERATARQAVQQEQCLTLAERAVNTTTLLYALRCEMGGGRMTADARGDGRRTRTAATFLGRAALLSGRCLRFDRFARPERLGLAGEGIVAPGPA